VNSSGVAVQEPISSELVLVDEELAHRARGALPDPPWLLPVLAELEESARARPAVATAEPPAPAAVAEPAPAPSRARIPTAAVVVFVVCALGPLAYLLYSLLPAPQGPTLDARPVQPATTPGPAPSGTTNPVGPTQTQPVAKPKPKPAQKPKPARPTARTRPKTAPPAPKRAAKPRLTPRPHTLTRAQRVFGWRRYAGALYYQFYFQRGATTIFQTRTLQPTAELPARLKVRPGTYKVLVRPAVPSDAGIILGAAILQKTMTL
jgi:hypothetical protein